MKAERPQHGVAVFNSHSAHEKVLDIPIPPFTPRLLRPYQP